jgi:large subunit ribosomal protein L21
MWEKFVKQWTDLVFWWVPRDAPTPEQNEKAHTPSKTEQHVAPAREAAPERVADDLTVIKGIGPAVQKKLRGLDIITFSDLAKADADALTEKLKGSQPISVARVRAWTEAARERSRV